MGLKAYKPTTSGRRGMTIVTTEELTKKRPEKGLTSFHLRTGGRNNDGRTTVRFRGAGHRRLYRKIDFRRDKVGISAKVSALEYDPNRSARIALLHVQGWREAVHSGADRFADRRRFAIRLGRRGAHRQCAAAVEHAAGYHDP